ncbi:phospholipase D/nuclease [Rhizodiscina lignyota]|uniref:Phospholipase n=1 Tax=Rhizodiscina lignyota TaxID=1504668 RepID=A0A9P4IMB5_9PEZI|nr:phospholipase D/nuclease [Rhizodiscina lignyota]
MSGNPQDDPLAYGDYHGQGEEAEGERGFIGDVYHRIRGRKDQSGASYHQSSSQTSGGGMSFVFDKLQQAVHGIGSEIKSKIAGEEEVHGHTHGSGQCSDGAHGNTQHRFLSFAPQRDGNDVKWYVDGCGYMWAVSRALEQARESIWILDWWLSPELYLRRPPAKNEQYRVDHMLQAAAQRGVNVNIIVYKEVTQALTRKYLNPTLPDYLHSLLPRSTDGITHALTRLGLDLTFKSLEHIEATDPLIAPPIPVSSAHTKHVLEELHPNIAVFRHPDHLPDQAVVASDIWNSIKNIRLTAANASKMPQDALNALYGYSDETVLYWAHHEKLLLVDGHTAFMGGLDLCYGRWDTNQHAISDVHPGDINAIVFPGQDYNNARIMDFQDVTHWQNNKLDRTKNSRMGWSDISICLTGPVVEDLKAHFSQRWNFIFQEKYRAKDESGRYKPISYTPTSAGRGLYSPQYEQQQHGDVEGSERGFEEEGERGFGGRGKHEGFGERIRERMESEIESRVAPHLGHHGGHHAESATGPLGGATCQITRSCAKWSAGFPLEHSIANAYIQVIKNSEHFVYIENQFFITASSDKQKPIRNMIGAAIVERVVRAARAGQKYKIFVLIPSVPAFAGDLRSDDALSTRAIMEFQYDSINRGGNSIMEQIARAGFDPTQYIRFYNLRNYDRINASGAMAQAEQQSGVAYEDARKQFDDKYGGGYGGSQQPGEAQQQYQAYNPNQGYGDQPQFQGTDPLQQYQQGAQQIGNLQGLGSGRWDSVSECYMLGGEDIRNVPWEGGGMDEIDAFVSEELYIHSKLLIADDRVVICGSANLNDRSQLGDHDSEIACIIQDPTPIDSRMNGQPHRASKFATSLRRQLFRKHLGLLRPQNMERPDANFEPLGQMGAPNEYDWGSPEDQQVVDPLDDEFLGFWNWRAKTNTDAFARVFHPVPFDGVRTWKQYDDYYEHFFKQPEKEEEKNKPSTYKWGHVVAEEFPGGVQEVKEVLSQIKGTLVEMPLLFLKDEDIAKEGLGLNSFTEEVYT